MKHIAAAYFDLLGKALVERKKQIAVPAANQPTENYENDLTASIKLLEQGYDVRAVMSVTSLP